MVTRLMYIILQGKSLSLICGALTWLQDYEERQRRELEALLSVKQEVKRSVVNKVKEDVVMKDGVKRSVSTR